jgi:multidrug resistance efflux pump
MISCGKKEVKQTETAPAPVTQIVGLGKIIPQGGISELASPGSGIVTEIKAVAGSKVKKGDLLVQLDQTDQRLAVQETDQKLASQQKSIESAQFLVDQKETALADKLRKLTDAQDLLKKGASTGENVRALQNDYDQALYELKKSKADLSVLQSQLSEISVQKAIKLKDLQQTSLVAPMDGVVLDIDPKVGEAVSQHQKYASLAPNAPLIVLAEIDEMFAGKLETGLACRISLAGEKESIASGKIINISADLKKKSLFSDSGEDLEDRRVREIEIAIDQNSQQLLINAKVACTIQIK